MSVQSPGRSFVRVAPSVAPTAPGPPDLADTLRTITARTEVTVSPAVPPGERAGSSLGPPGDKSGALAASVRGRPGLVPHNRFTGGRLSVVLLARSAGYRRGGTRRRVRNAKTKAATARSAQAMAVWTDDLYCPPFGREASDRIEHAHGRLGETKQAAWCTQMHAAALVRRQPTQIAEVQQRADSHYSRGQRQCYGAITNDQRGRWPRQAFPGRAQERRCAADHRGETISQPRYCATSQVQSFRCANAHLTWPKLIGSSFNK